MGIFLRLRRNSINKKIKSVGGSAKGDLSIVGNLPRRQECIKAEIARQESQPVEGKCLFLQPFSGSGSASAHCHLCRALLTTQLSLPGICVSLCVVLEPQSSRE
jgi:hypothetical protein